MNVSRFLALCAIFVCFTVSASVTVPAKVVHIANFLSSDSAGITLSGVVKGFASYDPFAARTVKVSKSRFMSFVKPNLGTLAKGNAWWVAFSAVIGAAGWAIDELSGQVTVAPPYSMPGWFWYSEGSSANTATAYSLPMDYATAACKGVGGTATFLQVRESDVNGPNMIRYKCMKGKTFLNIYADARRGSCSGSGNPKLPSSCRGGWKPVGDPVSDDNLYSAIQSQLAANPSATPFTDPATLKPYEGLFDDQEYSPGLSEADEALVKCYIAGKLQMTNSAASCYVPSQAEYDRIKAAAEALQAGKTADQVADELNEDLDAAAVDATDVTSITDAYGKSEIQDSYDELLKRSDGSGDITTPSDLPVIGDIDFPQYQQCRTITFNFNGASMVFPSADQCSMFEELKRGLGYFFYVLTAFGIVLELLRRSE